MLASTDRSTRHILPTAAPLVLNLAALWAADPALAERVERHSSAPAAGGGETGPRGCSSNSQKRAAIRR
jgi:hypothetical protein